MNTLHCNHSTVQLCPLRNTWIVVAQEFMMIKRLSLFSVMLYARVPFTRRVCSFMIFLRLKNKKHSASGRSMIIRTRTVCSQYIYLPISQTRRAGVQHDSLDRCPPLSFPRCSHYKPVFLV